MKKLSTIFIMALVAIIAVATEPKDIKVFINPGHGGHDSDDRNVAIPPFAQGDPEGFWESNSNLHKGLMLRDMLQAKGCKVGMSRVTNTTADDLGLGTIVRLANESNADIYFSIHSNATGTANRVNFPLMLFRGYDGKPEIPNADVLAGLLFPHLISNQASVWTHTNVNVRGDFSFGNWGGPPKGGLGALRDLVMPGMLSEGSFHDYIPETYRLMNMDFKKLEAWHFVKAVDDYFNFAPETTGLIAGCIYDSRMLRTDDYKMFQRDLNAPVNGAIVKLIDKATGSEVATYTTDNLQNGIYLFDNLVPGDYTVKVSHDTHLATEADVTVKANEVGYANIPMQRIRNTAPEVVSYTPIWNEGDNSVLCNTPIVMNFNWDMDTPSTEAAFTITPEIKGTFSWADSNYQLTFTPSELYNINTHYTVTLNKSAQHGGGMTMAKDVSFSFMTDSRAHMTVLGLSQQEGEEVHYKGVVLQINTDKIIDAAYVSDKILLKDSNGADVLMNKRGLSYNKAKDTYGWIKYPVLGELNIGEQYTVTFAASIADKDGITIDSDKVVTFTATNAGEVKEGAEVIAQFDDATLFSLNATNSVGYATSSIVKDTSAKLFDAACSNLKYTFAGDDGGVVEFELSALNDITVSQSDKVGIHINGDMSENEVYVIMISDSDTKAIKVCDLSFLGWKYLKVALNDLTNGKNYKFAGLKVVQTNALMGKAGAVKFDNLIKLSGQGGVSGIEIASLTVYPNPASEYIIANADGLIEGMQLISTSGATVTTVVGNIINVSEIASGNYILKIKIAGNYAIRKVVVSHN